MRHLAALCLALLAPAVAAQDGGPFGPPEFGPSDVGLSDSARASLLTMLPGEEVYSLFGHSAIRIWDEAAGLDRTYNFGTFSFDQPYFLLRFLRGSLDYSLDTAPFAFELHKYQGLRRPIIEQRLAIDPEVVHALYERLEINALPQNRDYRYDFFWDNCSTRLLDTIDSALVDVGRPGLRLPPVERPRTFRQLLEPYIVGNRPVDLGIDTGLGAPGDRVATAHEETFLPLELAAQLDRATVAGRPLVASRDTLFWVEGAGLPEPAPRWPTWIALGIAGVGLALSLRGLRRPPSRAGRLADAALFGLVGGVGLILALLWFGTTHDVAGPNWNLLWAWPTHLALAVALARDRLGAGWRRYLLAAAAVTGLTAVLWAVLPQQLPWALYPIVLLLVVRATIRARGNT